MWMSITGGKWAPQDEKKHPQKRLQPGDSVFVESNYHSAAGHNHRPPYQIRVLGHHSNRLGARGRLLLHILPAVQRVAGVQELAMIAAADQCFDLSSREPMLHQISKIQ